MNKLESKKTISLDNGKYTIVYDKTNSFPEECLRCGEPWRKLTGDSLIFFLCSEIEELNRELDIANACINTINDALTLNELRQLPPPTANTLEVGACNCPAALVKR